MNALVSWLRGRRCQRRTVPRWPQPTTASVMGITFELMLESFGVIFEEERGQRAHDDM